MFGWLILSLEGALSLTNQSKVEVNFTHRPGINVQVRAIHSNILYLASKILFLDQNATKFIANLRSFSQV
jgi:hypothetical protein